ncbi:GntR family transcriptional regulator [Streptomyces sp. NPDC012769]|uniref:GntR family transcriptional regulator n=1 Tax=Streptomyces sp. NPDC012769 TaxID=3364848 RepID=UPI0036892643
MSRTLKYQRIVNDIINQIENGEIKHKLPSMEVLRSKYNVSWTVMAQVWECLKSRKLIRVVPGVGTFLASAIYIPKQRKHR